jgi:mRNA-degrading endonuclease RelE of RelBE toxin-antitoxin system
MNFNVFSSSAFEKSLKRLKKKHPSLRTDLLNLIELLKNDPFTGTSIGKDCYKIRMAITSKGKGKSGGARVITCVKVIQENIFLLSIYDKSEKETIADHELIMLLEASGLL